MLGGLRDDVRPPVRVHGGHALDGQVVGLGCPAGKDDLCGLCADQRGNLLPSIVHGGFGGPPKGVGAAGCVPEFFAKIGEHGFQHPLIDRRGGMAVHVDGGFDRHWDSWCLKGRPTVCPIRINLRVDERQSVKYHAVKRTVMIFTGVASYE